MNWEERFRKLRNVKEEYEAKIAKKKEQRDSEIRSAFESFAPPIERVCKAFARALRCKYFQSTERDVKSFFIIGKERGLLNLCVMIWFRSSTSMRAFAYYQEKSGNRSEYVTIPQRAIVVSHHFGEDPPEEALVDIMPFNEFCEEKLAAVLEDYFKAIHKA